MTFARQFCYGNRLVIVVDLGAWFSIMQHKLNWPEMQYRNMTTVLTREYLDARPDGWLDYAAKRIAQLYGSRHLLA